MAYAIKAAIGAPDAATFLFTAQKTMYGGKHIAAGDVLFVFASENEGGRGLIARGVVERVEAVPRLAGIERQTPRVTLWVRRTALARRPLGRVELKPLKGLAENQPGAELNFKLYRQATNKVVGLSDSEAAFLAEFF